MSRLVMAVLVSMMAVACSRTPPSEQVSPVQAPPAGVQSPHIVIWPDESARLEFVRVLAMKVEEPEYPADEIPVAEYRLRNFGATPIEVVGVPTNAGFWLTTSAWIEEDRDSPIAVRIANNPESERRRIPRDGEMLLIVDLDSTQVVEAASIRRRFCIRPALDELVCTPFHLLRNPVDGR